MKGYVLKQARVLDRNELKRVLAVAGAGRNGLRNRLAVMLSHYAGLREGEIASLLWNDLLEADGSTKCVFYLSADNTKSGEASAVHMNQVLQKETRVFRKTLVQHSVTQECLVNGPVIASQKGQAFSANSLCQLFGRIYASAGIDGATSHSGRRWFITNPAHKGVSPKVIMELAGHKHLGTMQRYIDVISSKETKCISLNQVQQAPKPRKTRKERYRNPHLHKPYAVKPNHAHQKFSELVRKLEEELFVIWASNLDV